MDDYRTSFIVFSLNLLPPDAPSLGHISVPSLPGPKIPFLQLKITICNHSEQSSSSLAFPTATVCTWPYNTYIKPLTILSNLLQQIARSTSANCSTMEFPRRGSTHGSTYWCLLCTLILTTWAFLSSLSYFVSDNNQQQNLQIITHNGRLCTGSCPLWASKLGTTWWLVSCQTTPWKDAWS